MYIECLLYVLIHFIFFNVEERRLGDAEKLLWVQLNWGKDVREGRFLLKNENEKTVRVSCCYIGVTV